MNYTGRLDSSPAPSASASSNAQGGSQILPIIIGVLLILLFPFLMNSSDGQRAFLALTILLATISFLLIRLETGISFLLFYLSLMGGMRRWLIPMFGYSGTDPFLLVSPAVALLMIAQLMIQRRIKFNTLIGKVLGGLQFFMLLQVINPLQGGLGVGFAGAMFFLVPTLWYYIGFQMKSETAARRIIGLVIVLGFAVGLYGLYQTVFGLLPVEKEWMRVARYSQMLTNDVSRVFSSLTSVAEYTILLSYACVFCWALALQKNKLALFGCLFFFAMIVLSSLRSSMICTALALIILWAIQGRTFRSWVPRLVVALIVGVGGGVWSLRQVEKVQNNTGVISTFIGHQAQILDFENTTAKSHGDLLIYGVVQGFQNPLGRGIGATNIAAGRLGGQLAAGSETDIGDTFITMGFLGGFAYMTLIGMIFWRGLSQWQSRRSLLSLALVGLMSCSIFGWLNGGNYLTVVIIWLFIGMTDRAGEEATSLAAGAAK